MVYLYAFLFSGIICLLCELVYKKSKLTPGHITSFLVIIGALLQGFGVYEYLVNIFGGGIQVLILNFGALLTKGSIASSSNNNFLGIFKGIFSLTSGVIAYSIFLSFIGVLLPGRRK